MTYEERINELIEKYGLETIERTMEKCWVHKNKSIQYVEVEKDNGIYFEWDESKYEFDITKMEIHDKDGYGRIYFREKEEKQ